jgi:hypothetical protein
MSDIGGQEEPPQIRSKYNKSKDLGFGVGPQEHRDINR